VVRLPAKGQGCGTVTGTKVRCRSRESGLTFVSMCPLCTEEEIGKRQGSCGGEEDGYSIAKWAVVSRKERKKVG
jgi:hypothetical protein